MKRAKKRATPKGRMSESIIATVVAEIEAYGRKERTAPLSWAALEEFAGFSHVSLWAKPAIKQAYKAARETLRVDATPHLRAPRTHDQRIVAMQASLDEAREVIRIYDVLWATYEYNMLRLGLDAGELRRPPDAINRLALRRGSRR